MAEDETPAGGPPTAEQLRMKMLEKEMAEMERRQKALGVEQTKRAAVIDAFLHEDVSEKERAMIRRVVENAAAEGKLEALVYSFPSELCTDQGRAINSGDPDWPSTLQGKAKQLYDRYQEVAKPAGYRLKAMIVSFPGGMPGDVGFFLNWEPETT
ncbi:MAG: hypothetical protein ACFCUS_13780 [Rubrimonas sp.]|uniref:hypothetical protein n=1 Tax=Rubrimonas sp. TaxID=2036015 RepID=UPI002FDEB41E